MDFLNKRHAMYSIFLIFSGTVCFVSATIYSDTLFLSSYPSSWILYYFISQSLLSTAIAFLTIPLLTHNTKKNALRLLLSYTVLIGFIISISSLHFYWLPFAISLAVYIISPQIMMICWDLISLIFDVRAYKRILIYANLATSIGGITGSFLVPLLLSYFSLTALLLLLMLFLFICAVLTYHLPLIPTKHTAKSAPSSASKYPLYKNLLLYFAILAIALSLIDYQFKITLSHTFSKEQLAVFLGYFFGITNILGLISATFVSKYFLRVFKIPGLLYLMPVMTFIVAIVAIFSPSIWTIAILASTKTIFYYNQSWLGFEICMNVLPSAAQIAGKSQIKAVVLPIVTIVTYTVMYMIQYHINAINILLVTAFMTVLSLLLVKRINRAYKTTLEDEIEFQRFNFVKKINPVNNKIFEEIGLRSLHSSAERDIIFGLNVLKRLKLEKLPLVLYDQLNHPDTLIKLMVIDVLQRYRDIESLPYLIQQLQLEKDIDTNFKLLDLIFEIDPETALQVAYRNFDNVSHPIYPAALEIILRSRNYTDRKAILVELIILCNHADASFRKGAAFAIGSAMVFELEHELKKLIHDSSPMVVNAAISASARANFTALIPDILHALVPSGPHTHAIQLALVQFGDNAIPYLIDYINQSTNIFLPIKILALLPGFNAENALLHFAKQDSVYDRWQIATEVFNRSCRQLVSPTLKNEAIQLAIEEAYFIAYLYRLSLKHTKHIKVEIQSRIELAKKCVLLWIAVATNPIDFGKLMPALLRYVESSQDHKSRAKALELLDIYIKNKKLNTIIIDIFENPNVEKIATHAIQDYSDPWLTNLLNSQEKVMDGGIDILSKVFDLRSVKLFENFPAEILLIIAEETKQISYKEGEIIFKKYDAPNGLYCISSGKVSIVPTENQLITLQAPDFFGELALIDESNRAATAIAASDCLLLLIEKDTFERLTNDLPEIYKHITKAILSYLRIYT